MTKSTIGIMVADGTFYPVLESTEKGQKKLVLTTVSDNQESVHIKIYKTRNDDESKPQYVGNLLINDISLQEKGEPGIDLIMGIDEEGNLTAEAGESGSTERQSLNIDLKPLDDENDYLPDFELNEDESALENFTDYDDEKDEDEDKEFLDDLFDSEDTAMVDISEPEDELVDFSDDYMNDDSMEDDSMEDDSMEDDSMDDDSMKDDSMKDDSMKDDSMDDDSMEDDSMEDDYMNDDSMDDDSMEDDSMDDDSMEDDSMDDDSMNDDSMEDDSMDDDSMDDDSMDDEDSSSSSNNINYKKDYDVQDEIDERKKRKFAAIIILALLILVILGLGALLAYKGLKAEKIPPLEAGDSIQNITEIEENNNVVTSEDLEAIDEVITSLDELEKAVDESNIKVEPVGKEPVNNTSESLPIRKKIVDIKDLAPGQGGGVWYRLKWGDNLWDLSSSFYRTPWLYGLIAEENNIKNPDLIYAGSDLLIPEN